MKDFCLLLQCPISSPSALPGFAHTCPVCLVLSCCAWKILPGARTLPNKGALEAFSWIYRHVLLFFLISHILCFHGADFLPLKLCHVGPLQVNINAQIHETCGVTLCLIKQELERQARLCHPQCCTQHSSPPFSFPPSLLILGPAPMEARSSCFSRVCSSEQLIYTCFKSIRMPNIFRYFDIIKCSFRVSSNWKCQV